MFEWVTTLGLQKYKCTPTLFNFLAFIVVLDQSGLKMQKE